MRVLTSFLTFALIISLFACKNDKSESSKGASTSTAGSNHLPNVAAAPAVYTEINSLYDESMKNLETLIPLQKQLKGYLASRNMAAPPTDTSNIVLEALRELNRTEHALGEWKIGFNHKFDTLKTPEIRESYLMPKKAEIESIRNHMKFAIDQGKKASAILPPSNAGH